MELTERQYERIARRLDGEAVELDADERAVADEMHSLEAMLGGALDVEVPRAALQRAERRVSAEFARPRPRLRVLRFAAGAVAAAAMVMIAVWAAFGPTERPTPTPADLDAIVLSEDLLQPPEDAPDAELALLASELSKLETEILFAPPAPGEDVELKAMEREVDEFWLEDPPAGGEFHTPS